MSAILQSHAMMPVWLLMLLLPWLPIMNLCLRRGFRRRLCLFPRALVVVVAGPVASLLAALALVIFAPHMVPAVAACVAVLCLFLFVWRTRVNYGRGRRLPPGKLTLAPAGPWVDYLNYRHQADRYGEIYKMSHFLRPMICIASLPLGNEFLARHDQDTVTPAMPFNRLVPGGFMRYMAPAIHQSYRSRMKRVFSDPDILQQHDAQATLGFRSGLRLLAGHGAPVQPHGFIEQMTFSVLAELFFGLAPGSLPFLRLRAAYETIDYRRALWTPAGRVERALAEIESLVVAEARNGRSLLSHFLSDHREQHSDGSEHASGHVPGHAAGLEDPTLLRNFIFLLLTSWIDVADLLTWVFKFQVDEPCWVNTIRNHLLAADEVADNTAQALARNIVLETLRLEQSEYLMRRAVRDIEFNGYRIPRHWLVRICVREFHLDPRNFARPQEFNPDRFRSQSAFQQPYAPFGLHHKSCLGVAITLWAGQKFVLELARLGGWKVDRDGPRELGAFHWRPSRYYRVSAVGRPGVDPHASRVELQ